MAVMLSGGPAPAEREYSERVALAAGEPILNLIGLLSLGNSAELYRRALCRTRHEAGAYCGGDRDAERRPFWPDGCGVLGAMALRLPR
jgi:hypothetical protein